MFEQLQWQMLGGVNGVVMFVISFRRVKVLLQPLYFGIT